MKNYKKLFYAMLVGGLVYVGCAPLTSAMVADYGMSYRSRFRDSKYMRFTPQEDAVLIQKVKEQGIIYVDWKKIEKEFAKVFEQCIAQGYPGRTAKQLKDRWTNYLKPGIKKDPWTQGEDQMLISKVQEYGHKWSKISKFFQGRTDMDIKNHYQLLVRRENESSKKANLALLFKFVHAPATFKKDCCEDLGTLPEFDEHCSDLLFMEDSNF